MIVLGLVTCIWWPARAGVLSVIYPFLYVSLVWRRYRRTSSYASYQSIVMLHYVEYSLPFKLYFLSLHEKIPSLVTSTVLYVFSSFFTRISIFLFLFNNKQIHNHQVCKQNKLKNISTTACQHLNRNATAGETVLVCAFFDRDRW